MQTITLSENILRQLSEAAAQRGIDTNVHAEELLASSLAALQEPVAGISQNEGESQEQSIPYSEIVPETNVRPATALFIPFVRVTDEALAKRLVKTVVEDVRAGL